MKYSNPPCLLLPRVIFLNFPETVTQKLPTMPFEVVACALTLSFPKTFLETAVNKHAKL